MSTSPQYELYRVILDYEALQDGFLDRIEDLNTTLEQVDMAGKLLKGYAQKTLCKPPVKRFGWTSLGKMLKGTGLALVLVVDDARFAPIKAQMGKRERPARAIARVVRPPWLFSRDKAREMGAKRWNGVSDAERSRIMKKVARAKRKAKQQGAAHRAANEEMAAT